MSTSTVCPASEHMHLPCLNRVTWRQPLVWLGSGWEDFKGSWTHSLAYGALFALLGFGLVSLTWSHNYLAATLTSGFLLVAPFLALVFYDLSRRREQSDAAAFVSIRENLSSIGLFALLLAFTFSVWERLSAILLGAHLGASPVPEASLTWLFSLENLEFVIPFILVGGVMAAVIFSISVVSLPMLMDRRVDIVTAVMTSLWVVRENPLAMLVWATTIAVLTGIGIATSFIGLAVIFPVLGHATWHAYRELVQP
ncbi:MAG: DUF2189 domain-containing protein [Pseudomonadota bacterium]|nr:DUF2189 domain-containing protein [Pseudomonadota bacterium]